MKETKPWPSIYVQRTGAEDFIFDESQEPEIGAFEYVPAEELAEARELIKDLKKTISSHELCIDIEQRKVERLSAENTKIKNAIAMASWNVDGQISDWANSVIEHFNIKPVDPNE